MGANERLAVEGYTRFIEIQTEADGAGDQPFNYSQGSPSNADEATKSIKYFVKMRGSRDGVGGRR